jgi:predicted amidohydrolase
MGETVRVGAVQGGRTTISYKVTTPAEAMAQVNANLEALVAQAEEAAAKGCAIAAFGEDTLGTIEWEAGHWQEVAKLLAPAEEAMLERMGAVAARHTMNIIVCNDCARGRKVHNSSILIGPDGKEIGRYRKVNLPVHEQARTRGDAFPVFEAPGVGTIGMCICYDLVFPETTRALALAGADLVFHLTMGGASSASAEASMACTKARAAENYLYLVVAWRGNHSLVLSPKAETLASGKDTPGQLVFADIDLSAGREAGDAHGGLTADFRARLFRERVPSAYGILMDPKPPVLKKLSNVPVMTGKEAAALSAEIFTHASDAFYQADALFKEGKFAEAKPEFERLAARYGTTWIGRSSRERLQKIAEGQK